jgi:hypothetical protein
MDADARDKLHKTLDQSDPYGRNDGQDTLPELTAENIRATFAKVHADRQMYFDNCVEAVYRRLSWDHKTNTPGLFGEVLIISGLVSTWGGRKFQGETTTLEFHPGLQDLERVLAVLDRQPLPTYEFGLRSMKKVPWGVWTTVPSATRPTMEVKVFRKGTAHVRILDREHVIALNAIMGKRYPNAIGTGDRRKKRTSRSTFKSGLEEVRS